MSDPKSVKSDHVSVKADPERIVAFLREVHPLKTALSVEARSGIPAETVKQWLKGVSAPSIRHFISLIGAYGPEILVAAFPRCPRWLDEASRAERRRSLELDIDALRRKHDQLGVEDAVGRVSTDCLGGGCADELGGGLRGVVGRRPVDRT